MATRKPATQKQINYIAALAAERGLRVAKPLTPETDTCSYASFVINELLSRFSLTHGLFTRDFITTGIFEVIDRNAQQ